MNGWMNLQQWGWDDWNDWDNGDDWDDWNYGSTWVNPQSSRRRRRRRYYPPVFRPPFYGKWPWGGGWGFPYGKGGGY